MLRWQDAHADNSAASSDLTPPRLPSFNQYQRQHQPPPVSPSFSVMFSTMAHIDGHLRRLWQPRPASVDATMRARINLARELGGAE